MDKNIIYVNDDITTNSIKCPKLIVHNTIEIKDEYVIYGESGNEIFNAPIKNVISLHIVSAKLLLDDLKNDKSNVLRTKKYIRSLTQLIILMDKVDIANNWDLQYLYMIDGLKEERELAKQSYMQQKKNAKKILQEQEKNYKTKKKNIEQECLVKVSLLLKGNGLKNHKNSASVILRDNGIDIPTSY